MTVKECGSNRMKVEKTENLTTQSVSIAEQGKGPLVKETTSWGASQ